MQFCQDHWEKLRQSIKDRGMFHLVSASEEQAVSRIKKETDGQSIVPDPLLQAHNMILERSLQFMGIGIMSQQQDGSHYCPLCEADKYLPPHPETKLICSESWIVTLADYLKSEYQKERWIAEN